MLIGFTVRVFPDRLSISVCFFPFWFSGWDVEFDSGFHEWIPRRLKTPFVVLQLIHHLSFRRTFTTTLLRILQFLMAHAKQFSTLIKRVFPEFY